MTTEVKKLEPLAPHTFYGVGGSADEFYTVTSTEEFLPLWAETIALSVPKIILGKGSNLLFSDRGFRGRVFVLGFKETTQKDNHFITEAGQTFQTFLEQTNAAGFSDLCPLSGIPGTVGGFVRGNAGAFGAETGQFLASVDYADETGTIHTLPANQCQFAYRESLFKHHPDWCILRATFKLAHKADPTTTLQKSKDLLNKRWATYPPGRSGGSFFKNPPDHHAGQLLDTSGAKGDRIGDAQISDIHANFFLNRDKATQADLLALAHKWQTKVKETHNIQLEPEVFLCNEFGKQITL